MAAVSLVTAAILACFAKAETWTYTNIKYGPADRQYLNIYVPPTAVHPAPTFFFSHGNGGNAEGFIYDNAQEIAKGGYSSLSWESVRTLSSPADIFTCWSDAELLSQWYAEHAAEYGLDRTQMIIGGNSRGSVCSWPLAHNARPQIKKGIYMHQALPDPVWMFPSIWYPVDAVSSLSPPAYLTYNPVLDEPGDIHNPANGYRVADRYEELGLNITVKEGLAYNPNVTNVYQFFAGFVATL